MPRHDEIDLWMETIRLRYKNYLKTSFYFKDAQLRESFASALTCYNLVKGPFTEPARDFLVGVNEHSLIEECFPNTSENLIPAFHDRVLWKHQEDAIRTVYQNQKNIVVASGTASGKTESFFYPILFSLYNQHLNGQLKEDGVRALVLYPMNALANDQRRRLGEFCKSLKVAGSDFKFTFGQYTGQTPENHNDNYRKGKFRQEQRLDGELVFRNEMRETPPHVLLTNYSMLEYLLIRPTDSPLFDNMRSTHWQFIVLDEAHQYRGVKGMEVGMLMRRLKQRLRDGGRIGDFSCIATSATITSNTDEATKDTVAKFATELFGESFESEGVIFGQTKPDSENQKIGRYHSFVRALEGAFLLHLDSKDSVVLNRTGNLNGHPTDSIPIEIALCRECGQHYYVGRKQDGKLAEAVRDPSQPDFGVDYYLPVDQTQNKDFLFLCRQCASLSTSENACRCGAAIPVHKCDTHHEHADQLKACESCGYKRGYIGDPVQEIIHGSDGPNTVIATALHGLLPEDRRRILAFADSRQEAAFFAWYAQDSYEKVRDRNILLRTLRSNKIESGGLSIDDVLNRLIKQWDHEGLFAESDTRESRKRKVFTTLLREALTDERRLSLAGVGLVKWSISIPSNLTPPESSKSSPWNLNKEESRQLFITLLDEWRIRRALGLPDESWVPNWGEIAPNRPQMSYRNAPAGKSRGVGEWGNRQSAIVSHFLVRLLEGSGLSSSDKLLAAIELMKDAWSSIREYDQQHTSGSIDRILVRTPSGGAFRLNYSWLRVNLAELNELWMCSTCLGVTTNNIRNICLRNRCPGKLAPANSDMLRENHYRVLYESDNFPPVLRAEEHTAQIVNDEAALRQELFKEGAINLLSSSTTFEMGVDLGELDVVFLRNVPPETFNYTQRAGRAGRRELPGLALTYCRRNPHDLYHYENPVNRIIRGNIKPPLLRMTNEKIINRHIAATAFSHFFRAKGGAFRFTNVEKLVGNWDAPCLVSDLRAFCLEDDKLESALYEIVPKSMHGKCGLESEMWIDSICGPESRLVDSEADVCEEYCRLETRKQELFVSNKSSQLGRIMRRMNTIAGEDVLSFLSRKAVIPKYGFPVDVVELDTRPEDRNSTSISLQRNLSLAISEYAPGGQVVADKKEYKSCGVKRIPGKEFPIKCYRYDDALKFEQWDEGDSVEKAQRYLQPTFGFVTSLFAKGEKPQGRARRLYPTRPFFKGFTSSQPSETKKYFGIEVTKALPGTLVVLCEGRNKKGFLVCTKCGKHEPERTHSHSTCDGVDCEGTLQYFSFAHELVTDVVRLQFSHLIDQWVAYSLGYALLLGAAETLDVPSTELDITITSVGSDDAAIVLYDNVPGGAGLVAEFERESMLQAMLEESLGRVSGGCGCDSSCYGCLRSYRNQFAHTHLDRKIALKFLDSALKSQT